MRLYKICVISDDVELDYDNNYDTYEVFAIANTHTEVIELIEKENLSDRLDSIHVVANSDVKDIFNDHPVDKLLYKKINKND